MEDKILNHEYYDKIKCTRDALRPLKINKQQNYSARSEELHTVHNQVMLTINLFRLCQEHHQNALRNPKQVQSNETRMLAIATKIGEYEQEAKVVLKKKALKYKR